MTDHRRTPSQRAYRLPGWFFVLTAALSLVGFALAGWVLLADPFAKTPAGTGSAASSAPSVRPTTPETSDSADTSTASSPTASAVAGERSGITVLLLNASDERGLAATVAETAENKGWTSVKVGNWIYPAAVNAVYYSADHRDQAELLADDLDIHSVRHAIRGMSADDLTVLLVYAP